MSLTMFEPLAADVRFALRLIARKPRLYATIFIVLIGGIATTTAMFSIVKSLLIEPLPFPHAERLTAIFAERPGAAAVATSAGAPERLKVSLPDFYDWRARTRTFEHMALVRPWLFSLASAGKPAEGALGVHVSGEFFRTLGIEAKLGRLLDERDDRQGGPRVAVLSHALWEERFDSDPHIVGSTVRLDDEPFTVVGIAPEGFVHGSPELQNPPRIWAPFAATYPGYEGIRTARDHHDAAAIGRLKAGVRVEEAQAELSSFSRAIEVEHPGHRVAPLVAGLQEELVGAARASIYVLLAAVVLVFLVVCSNVANLLLTSVLARRAELATRAALGATRARLTRQIVTEAVLLFLLAAPLGALLALGLVELFQNVSDVAAAGLPVRLDAPAIAICLLLCLLSGVLTGLVAARSLSDLGIDHVLKEHASGASPSRSSRSLSAVLVAAQVAIACTLLVGSGLALRGFYELTRSPYGFQSKNLATGVLLAVSGKYWDVDELTRFYERVVAAVADRPDVEAAAAASALPLLCIPISAPFEIEGRPEPKTQEKQLLMRNIVTPGYFRTLGIPLLRGRSFTAADRRSGPPVIIISQSVAERYFPGEDPLGLRILHHGDEAAVYREIVGVVADIRRRGPFEAPIIESYVPMTQAPWRSLQLAVRSPNAEALLAELPAIVARVDPNVAIANPKLMDAHVTRSFRTQAVTAFLLGAFALAALLLATLGIYGLVTYATSRRTRELGIRLALGTPARVVVLLVMRSGLSELALGLALGSTAALGLGRVVARHVAGAKSFDPWVWFGIVGVLFVVGAVSCFVPAWRAVRTSPASALRYE